MESDPADQRFLVVLSPIRADRRPPCFLEIGNAANVVVSYGRCFEIKIDQADEVVDLGARKYYDDNGVLVLTPSGMMMRVEPYQFTGYHAPRHYDVQRFRLVAAPQDDAVALFAKWSLRLTTYEEKDTSKPPLITFDLRKPPAS